MKFFYRDSNGAKAGPYSAEEMRALHLSGVVKPETETFEGESATGVPFRDVWPRVSSATNTTRTRSTFEDFAHKTTEDVRALIPHLLVPLEDIRTLKWIENRKLLAIAGLGLLPLFLWIGFAQSGEVKAAYWGLALYFSVLWAVFFYYVFPAPQVTLVHSVMCFFVTGIVSITLLLLLQPIWPLNWLLPMTESHNPFARLFAFLVGVGIPEELTKALVLFVLVRRGGGMAPQSMLFYGLMSGLGFGIYEGVNYQTGRNLLTSMGFYYLLNVLRLTSLPFLHAMWTGIAGYFIGFAYQYSQRKKGLLVIAIGVPALLHGFYDFFSSNVIGLFIALISVLALYLYLAKSVYFEQVLAGTAPATPSTPPPSAAGSSPSDSTPPPIAPTST